MTARHNLLARCATAAIVFIAASIALLSSTSHHAERFPRIVHVQVRP